MSAVTAAVPELARPGAGLSRRSGVLARLARDKIALVAAIVLSLIVLAALAAPLISPYDPYYTDLPNAWS